MADKKEPIKMQSADALIIKAEAEKFGKVAPEMPKVEVQSPPIETPQDKPKQQDIPEQKSDDAEEPEEEKEIASEESKDKQETLSQDEPAESDELDEYGTKVGKKKLYTEEEVNRMMRDRFKRGRTSEEQQQDIKDIAKDFTPDPNSNEEWETQLGSFIDKHLDSRNRVAQEKEWKAREEQSMAEFEVKFSEGMTKYKDFQSVIANKPISQAMMLSTRSMENPAAFIYAACKQQPKEVARIAEIADPMAQAVEMGRLEEKMRKARIVPSSPKPAKQISGDASHEMKQIGIDDRIAQHAKSKLMNRR